MGTPEFAVPGLKALVENQWDVVAVITAPDKPKGRGQKTAISPVKEYALSANIPVLQPTKLKNPQFLEELRQLEADVQVVIAFRMLPKEVWQMPPLGTFNLHASLLPKYRGAAPINWAIINGEKETGLTTFFLQHEIDTGDIIFQEKEPIYPNDTAGTLYERLMNKGASLVLRTIESIAGDTLKTRMQVFTDELPTAPKIFKETCEINWDRPAHEIVDFVRGMAPYPGAWATIQGTAYKIFEVLPTTDANLNPGQVDTDQKTRLLIGTKDKPLSIMAIQAPGKRKMNIVDYLRGNLMKG